MKLRYLAASLMIAVAGCADGTSGLSSTTKEAALDLPTRSTESKLVCELIVSCKDGTEVKESVSSEAECDALQEKAQTYDYDHCQVKLESKLTAKVPRQ
jgi:hypothetical protein